MKKTEVKKVTIKVNITNRQRKIKLPTDVKDLENVFSQSVEILGGKIDFVLHSIGMSPNVRKKRTYDDLDYNFLGFVPKLM